MSFSRNDYFCISTRVDDFFIHKIYYLKETEWVADGFHQVSAHAERKNAQIGKIPQRTLMESNYIHVFIF